MISQSTIEEIKNRMDIVDVVGDYVNLKKSGSSFKALSPFTAEKTPSFFVVPSKGIFKCFSSGKGGDTIKFVMEIDGLSYVEALKYLATKYGVEIVEDEQTDEAQEAQNKRESLYIVLNYACEYFQEQLSQHEEGQSIGYSYFQERGFTDQYIEQFRLGYALDQWDDFYQSALSKGYDKDIIEEAGLVVRKEERVYDRFRGRVIFPIQNVSGKVIAFGARILAADKKQPKYVNSPESELYHKSQVLYGIYQAKQTIRTEDNCYLVEGYTDVIGLHQVGVKNVVSSSGTALTGDQAKLVRRYTENITIVYDGDPAGIRASFRGIDILLESSLNVKVVPLPDGEDPDSYSKQLGTTAFQHYLSEKATDFIRFKTSLLMEEVASDPVRKAGIIKDIVTSISKIGDAIKRALYIKECSDLLDISESVLIAEQNKILLEKKKNLRRGYREETPELPRETLPIEDDQVDTLDIGRIIAYQEEESIRLLLNYGNEVIHHKELQNQQLLEYFLDEAEEIQFTHPVYNRILQHFRVGAKKGLIPDVEYFIALQDNEIEKTVIEMSAPRYEISEFWKTKYDIHVPHEKEHLKDVTFTNILRLKFRIIQHLIDEESEKLRHASNEEVDTILDEIKEMKRMEVEIAGILGNVTVK